MSLEDQVAVITGGNGIVGSGIVRVFLKHGATVIAPVRSESSKSSLLSELDQIPGKDDRLETPVIDYGNEQGIHLLADYIRTNHKSTIDHVVACFGGSFKLGTVSTLTPQDLTSAFERVIPHLLLAQSLFPLLKNVNTSSYIFIDGALGENMTMPNCASLSIVNAALYGVIRSLEAEQMNNSIRINELRIGALIRKDSQTEHPFIPGHAFASSLIGNEVVNLAVDVQKDRVIKRIFSDYLKEKEEEREVCMK